MSENLLIVNADGPETRVALMENDSLVELFIERGRAHGLVGNIYKGRVVRVLPGMQAAFVDIGESRAGYLYVADVGMPHSGDAEEARDDPRSSRQQRKIQDVLSQGHEILVQVTKAPMGSKGARVSTELSLPGRNLVFVPTMDHVGISRRIVSEPERKRLRSLMEQHRPKGTGLIVRTVAEGMSENELLDDLEYLTNLWEEISNRAKKAAPTTLVYDDLDLVLRTVRDYFTESIGKLVVDDEATYQQIVRFAKVFMPHLQGRIEHVDRGESVFDVHGVDAEIDRALSRTVFLKSGGSLVIDEGEALTAIDVNTGRFVGRRNLEETITANNLEACQEVAQQLRLRNIGGIIVVDFIDMEKQENRDKVWRKFSQALEDDRNRSSVSPISDLGLAEMTRKRTRPSLARTLTEPCFYCEGKGQLKSKLTIAYDVLRELRRRAIETKSDTLVVLCHPEIADTLATEELDYVEHIEQRFSKRIAIEGQESTHLEDFEIMGRKTYDKRLRKQAAIDEAKNAEEGVAAGEKR